MHLKKLYLPLFFFFLLTVVVDAQHWRAGTAVTLPQNEFAIGSYQPSRYGVFNDLEIAAHPFFFTALPHLHIKKQWLNRKMKIASRHSFLYPTWALKLGKTVKEDWYERPGDPIPSLLYTRHEFLLSRYFKRCSCCPFTYLATLKAGISTGFSFDSLNGPVINYPLLHMRSLNFQEDYIANLGFDLEGQLHPKIDFSVDADYRLAWNAKVQSVEHKALIIYKPVNYVYFMGGYKFIWTDAQNIKPWSLYPMIDLVFYFARETQPKNGLMRKGWF